MGKRTVAVDDSTLLITEQAGNEISAELISEITGSPEPLGTYTVRRYSGTKRSKRKLLRILNAAEEYAFSSFDGARAFLEKKHKTPQERARATAVTVADLLNAGEVDEAVIEVMSFARMQNPHYNYVAHGKQLQHDLVVDGVAQYIMEDLIGASSTHRIIPQDDFLLNSSAHLAAQVDTLVNDASYRLINGPPRGMRVDLMTQIATDYIVQNNDTLGKSMVLLQEGAVRIDALREHVRNTIWRAETDAFLASQPERYNSSHITFDEITEVLTLGSPRENSTLPQTLPEALELYRDDSVRLIGVMHAAFGPESTKYVGTQEQLREKGLEYLIGEPMLSNALDAALSGDAAALSNEQKDALLKGMHTYFAQKEESMLRELHNEFNLSSRRMLEGICDYVAKRIFSYEARIDIDGLNEVYEILGSIDERLKSAPIPDDVRLASAIVDENIKRFSQVILEKDISEDLEAHASIIMRKNWKKIRHSVERIDENQVLIKYKRGRELTAQLIERRADENGEQFYVREYSGKAKRTRALNKALDNEEWHTLESRLGAELFYQDDKREKIVFTPRDEKVIGYLQTLARIARRIESTPLVSTVLHHDENTVMHVKEGTRTVRASLTQRYTHKGKTKYREKACFGETNNLDQLTLLLSGQKWHKIDNDTGKYRLSHSDGQSSRAEWYTEPHFARRAAPTTGEMYALLNRFVVETPHFDRTLLAHFIDNIQEHIPDAEFEKNLGITSDNIKRYVDQYTKRMESKQTPIFRFKEQYESYPKPTMLKDNLGKIFAAYKNDTIALYKIAAQIFNPSELVSHDHTFDIPTCHSEEDVSVNHGAIRAEVGEVTEINTHDVIYAKALARFRQNHATLGDEHNIGALATTLGDLIQSTANDSQEIEEELEKGRKIYKQALDVHMENTPHIDPRENEGLGKISSEIKRLSEMQQTISTYGLAARNLLYKINNGEMSPQEAYAALDNGDLPKEAILEHVSEARLHGFDRAAFENFEELRKEHVLGPRRAQRRNTDSRPGELIPETHSDGYYWESLLAFGAPARCTIYGVDEESPTVLLEELIMRNPINALLYEATHNSSDFGANSVQFRLVSDYMQREIKDVQEYLHETFGEYQLGLPELLEAYEAIAEKITHIESQHPQVAATFESIRKQAENAMHARNELYNHAENEVMSPQLPHITSELEQQVRDYRNGDRSQANEWGEGAYTDYFIRLIGFYKKVVAYRQPRAAEVRVPFSEALQEMDALLSPNEHGQVHITEEDLIEKYAQLKQHHTEAESADTGIREALQQIQNHNQELVATVVNTRPIAHYEKKQFHHLGALALRHVYDAENHPTPAGIAFNFFE